MNKAGPKQLPRAERFWMRVDKSGECWLWTGTVLKKRGGYGTFWDDGEGLSRGKLRRASRVAYELAHGVSLDDPQVKVRHTCDNPPCVRPEHLVLGSQGQNLDDMRSRGRGYVPPHTRGEARYNARLTEEVVREARERHAAGESFSALARAYGVSRPCITSAVKGRWWRHVT